MTKSVSKKMGIKEGMRAIFINAPVEAIEAIDLPGLDIVSEFTGSFDYIHLFAKTQTEFREFFPELKVGLKPSGMLWASWPKNGQLETDLSLTKIIHLGYGFGLVESTSLSIDSTWSALKFTHPKKGKVYNNSYGTLNR
ncbi:MAG: hypothetical protein H7Y04_15495 [Verrucomicrobia bacterium]|nr:hypothetical protein [Cytophagales bacterium]